ncbi:MAG: nucleotidyltransferase domain-containing protein [Crocinitomicaceae bacterium]|jgi:predicted nucleotidyltransferase|nr:nucleotidyltransferase domain-containing protein [Crocinitomicaceae bacterium]
MVQLIEINKEAIIKLCSKHFVDKLFLFGSAVRNEMTSQSDVDLLVEFSESIPLLDYADNYFSLKFGLEEILNKNVDLVSFKSLKNEILINEINNSKVELYAA